MITSTSISTKEYITQWQEALSQEIGHLKKYGSHKYVLMNGNQIQSGDTYTYYFETMSPLKIPIGTVARLERDGSKYDARVLSAEGNTLLVSLDQSIGDLIDEAFISHDPWELLEQLIERLDDIKKSKRKRSRVKRLMNPDFPDKRTRTDSKTAVQELFQRSKYNPVTFVWGPPGTGKTYTLARTAANKYFKDKRVLVLSHSNQAVDVLLGEMAAFIKKADKFRTGDLLRYGNQAGDGLLMHGDILPSQLLADQDAGLLSDKDRITEEKRLLKKDLSQSFSVRDSQQLLELEQKLGRILDRIRKQEMKLVKEASIIGTTLAKAANDPVIFEQEYDLVIVDEASMAFIPQIAFAVSMAKRAIVCGDFKQLPPIAASRGQLVDTWLREDIFHRAGVADIASGGVLHPHLFLLKEQRRMHPDISAFTNQYLYNSLVGDHPSVQKSREEIVARAPFEQAASILLDASFTGEHCFTGGTSGSRMNIMHALLSLQLLHEAYQGGSKSIGDVTPYRAQAILMEKLLQDFYPEQYGAGAFMAATVHRFQGSERELMIFDTVDSYPERRAGMLLTGKESERLLNVAITRTKGKLIHVSDVNFLKNTIPRYKTLHQFIDFQLQHNKTVGMDQIGKWIKHPHPKLKWMYARKLDDVLNDVKEAQSQIILSLPNRCILSKELAQALTTRPARAKLALYSKEEHPYLDPDLHIQEGPPFSMICIDRRFLWLGIPIEANRNVDPPYVAVRLDSEETINYILQQLPRG